MLRSEAQAVNAVIRPPQEAAAARLLLRTRMTRLSEAAFGQSVPLDSHMSHTATVLVVDDDVDAADTMREILADEGHCVLVAKNGREALELTRARKPDLVLLDLEMPEMDGRAFLAEVRAEPDIAKTRVVVLSGAADAQALGTEAVTKPLRLDTLLGLIDTCAHAAE
jgi:CheY-like chemotaxis protein